MELACLTRDHISGLPSAWRARHSSSGACAARAWGSAEGDLSPLLLLKMVASGAAPSQPLLEQLLVPSLVWLTWVWCLDWDNMGKTPALAFKMALTSWKLVCAPRLERWSAGRSWFCTRVRQWELLLLQGFLVSLSGKL